MKTPNIIFKAIVGSQALQNFILGDIQTLIKRINRLYFLML